MRISKKDRQISKIANDLFDMTREEIRAYVKAIVNGASENGTGITFIYKGFEIWAGNFDNKGRASSTNARKLG